MGDDPNLLFNLNHITMKKFLLCAFYSLTGMLYSYAQRYARSYEVIGFPDGKEIEESISSAIPLLITTFIVYKLAVKKEDSHPIWTILFIGLIIATLIVLMPLFAYVEAFVVIIVSIIGVIAVIIAIFHAIFK